MINLKTTENSVKLLTKDKFCNDDINVTFEGGSSGKKEIVTITEPILQHIPNGPDIMLQTDFSNIEFDNKYIIWDLNIEKTTESGFERYVSYFQLDFTDKKPKNSTMLITFPPFEDFDYERITCFSFDLNKGFVTIDNCRAVTNINYEGFRYANDSGSSFYFDFGGEVRYSNVFIKIDFDEYGFATIYVYDEYEI